MAESVIEIGTMLSTKSAKSKCHPDTANASVGQCETYPLSDWKYLTYIACSSIMYKLFQVMSPGDESPAIVDMQQMIIFGCTGGY